ncbi:hypothetical protein KEM55_002024 [Ascosphaera atra]|nr:hypothetical protein KEM55_002024 [Ascosphaera atra]
MSSNSPPKDMSNPLTKPDTISEDTRHVTERTSLLSPDPQTERRGGGRRPSKVISYHDDDYGPGCGSESCIHGTFEPRAMSDAQEHASWMDKLNSAQGGGGSYGSYGTTGSGGGSDSSLTSPRSSKKSKSKRKSRTIGKGDPSLPQPGVLVPVQTTAGQSATRTLAFHHGVDNTWRSWTTQYRLSYLKSDFIAALTMASIYIPMSLSYATSIAGAPAVNGLYAYAIQPLLYALLGSSSMMVVGPEAAGSLLAGTVVRESLGASHEPDKHAAHIVGLVTGLSGAISLVAGLTRLGYLDTILSRPFLRGFISAIGITIIIDQFVPELGLDDLARDSGITAGSAWQKLVFVLQNGWQAHRLTAGVATASFALCFVFKYLKRLLQPHFHWVMYFPDRFLIVVASALLTWKFEWDQQGLDILGPLGGEDGEADAQQGYFEFRWPFSYAYMKEVHSALSTSFIIALLGFFESSVASKGLEEGAAAAEVARSRSNASERSASVSDTEGASSEDDDATKTGEDEEEEDDSKKSDGVKTTGLSANRELVALGVANVIGGCYMALPAFGGYARSKLNASAGAKSPASSIMLAGLTVACMYWVLPYFEYLPTSVLSSMISVVALSLIEEAPHDISFFVRVKGWSELSLMLTIFCATMFYSLYLGIGLGIGLSVLQIIRHASKPRIQILGRVKHPHEGDHGHETDHTLSTSPSPSSPSMPMFENAELHPERVSFVEGCLIVKIPEPLTFANTGDLKNRLRRLEFYGTSSAHPSLPRVRRPEHNRNIIFDVHGVTSIDASGTQVLCEIVQGYVAAGVRVFFCRGPDRGTGVLERFERSGIVEVVGGEGHFVKGVEEALKLTEEEEEGEEGELDV